MGKRESEKIMEVAVLAVAFLLGGCSAGRDSFVRPSPPYEAAQFCRQIQEPVVSTANDLSLWVASVLDDYSECAVRHRALVEWAKESP